MDSHSINFAIYYKDQWFELCGPQGPATALPFCYTMTLAAQTPESWAPYSWSLIVKSGFGPLWASRLEAPRSCSFFASVVNWLRKGSQIAVWSELSEGACPARTKASCPRGLARVSTTLHLQ
jgi:hypothetical protein